MVAARGGRLSRSPGDGSVVPASKGALTVLVSGERPAFEEALPYLNLIGSQIIYLNRSGSPAK